jgi:gliding motility-associated-like protein
LDGDGKPDLAVANNGSATVSVYRNTSTSGSIVAGSFEAKVDFATGSRPYSVAIGDLDGDGKPDLAVANYSSNSVSVLRNNPVFPPPTITSFTPTSGAVGATVTITGTGFNTTPANNIVFFGATRATVTAAIATSLTVTVPIGATFGAITVLNTGISLAAYSTQFFNPTFSPNKSSITTADIAAKVDFTTGSGPISVAIGDLDGDGKPDLAVANLNSNTVSVYRNTSTSGLIAAGSFAAKVDFTTGSDPFSVAIGDLDGDGKPDLAVANQGSNTVSVYRNTSTSGLIAAGSFAAKVDFTTGSQPYSVAIGDLDGDGKPDLAVANVGSNTVSVFRNTSTSGSIAAGSFEAKVDFTTGTNPFSVAIGDLDGDGKPDLAVANRNSNSVSVYRNTSSSGLIAAGSFAAKVDFTTGGFPLSVAIGDLDGDGKPDLAVANRNSNSVSVFRNTSSSGSIAVGSFAAKVDFTTGTNPFSVAIGDLDGDGKPDLAVINNGSSTVSVYRNADILSSNADLSAMSISAGTLAPAFASGTTTYTASVNNATTGITLTPTRAEANATITVNGTAVASGAASGNITLTVGANVITTIVTAQDGSTTKTYTTTVTRAGSANADLSAMSISAGTLAPAFASGTTTYTASVNNATTGITLTPTRAEANATITVNGTAVASGAASGNIALSVGSNTITTVVTAQDGSTTKTYTTTVTRAGSANADLSAMSISAGTLAPAFVSGTTTYTASVNNATTSITVTPTRAEANATITVNGTAVASGSASGNITLTVGANVITTVVTAQDGSTTKTYTTTVTRAGSANADLSALAVSTGTLSPTFASGTTAYNASVSNATTSITVPPTRAEANATITVNGTAVTSGSASGNITLTVGANTITTVVTAQDGTTTKTYTVTVTRAGTASSITFTADSFVFDGAAKSLAITGTLPAGTSVAYSNNSRTDVGTQQVTATITGANYQDLILTAELIVTKATVTITATNLTKVYGETNPAPTFTYSGLVNGDTKVTAEPGIGTTATAGSNVGTYPITLTGGSDQNYAITLVNGTLTVTKAILKIQANSRSKIVGAADSELTFTGTGFKGTDNPSSLTGVLVRETGEQVGLYPIGLGTLKSSNNYQLEFVSAQFQIIPAELAAISDANAISTPWSVNPTLPAKLSAVTDDGQVVQLSVTWNTSSLNLFKRGSYSLSGIITLPAGILNPQELKVVLVVRVLPKSAPQDVRLTNSMFDPSPTVFFQEVGAFIIQDPTDKIHVVSLQGAGYDNSYFEIKENILFWSSSDRAEGKTTFTIIVRVTDRDGNTLDKFFEIERKRTEISDIEVFSSFTPNGDRINDTWGVPDIRYYRGARIQVFDRSGQRLFYTEDPDVRWDGMFEGKEMPVGSYIWILETRETGEIRRGVLTLLKK